VADALAVRVRSITYLADDVNAYEVVPLASASLPPFTAGAHIDLYFRDGRVRQYSLCGDPARTDRYVFAVQREPAGRGGSIAVHEIVRTGRVLSISPPRNNFPLREDARHHILIAGGIGITPIVAMIRRLLVLGASFEVHYAARTADKLAFHDELTGLGLHDRLHVYVDGGDPRRGMPLAEIERTAPADTQFYCCGPTGLMSAFRTVTGHRPPGSVRFELFAPPSDAPLAPRADAASDDRFTVELARRGTRFEVPPDKTIVEVLREHGIEVPTSCEAGICGTCRTHYLAGEPDHRDYVLDDDERARDVLICCARSKTPTLVLDL
jgi:vanillate O-demethylase ferredoxin subunit